MVQKVVVMSLHEKTFKTQFRVYVEDTDLMGIMYHANYLRFFERARTEIFRELGQSLTALAEQNYHFAIHEVNMRFLSPARLDDCVSISTKISEHASCSVVFEQSMQNLDNSNISGNEGIAANRLLCKAIVRVVCINEQMKPQRLPSFLLGDLG